VEAHVNRYLGAHYLSSRCWHIFIKVLWLCEFFLILKLFVICYSFAQLKTHFLHLTILSHLVIFFVEVLTDLKVENIRYCVSDKVSHNVLDCKVIQTKWLFWIATYTLNNGVFELVTIHIIFTWSSFANLRQVYICLSAESFHFIKLQKGVESGEPAEEVCDVYLGNPFLLFDQILVEITSSFIRLSPCLNHETVDF
jgi:hypothetical protein